MIVLRKIKKSSNIVVSGLLVGEKNGNNKVFNTLDSFDPDNIRVLVNGQGLKKDIDFEVSGVNEVTLIYIAPLDEDNIGAIYEVV